MGQARLAPYMTSVGTITSAAGGLFEANLKVASAQPIYGILTMI